MTKLGKQILALVLIVFVVAAALLYVLQPQKSPIEATVSIADTVNGGDLTGFQRVTAPRVFNFPNDHGPHHEYQTEWWYYTGNLQGANDRQWGYQLTFFRRSLTPTPATRTSAWATNEVYLAHFTLSDIDGNAFYAFDRTSRGGEIGLAGASASPYQIFVEDWTAQGTGDQVHLAAATEQISISLDLTTRKTPTLQGEAGFSQKSTMPGDGNASYYYSYTDMETRGTIVVQGVPVSVEGQSWFDHEWGTSALSQNQVGWDWFGLHLDDGRDIMWGQLRRADGSIDVSHGSITKPADTASGQGEVIPLKADMVQVSVLDQWVSPKTQAAYPAAWRLQIPSEGLDLTVKPFMADQELRFAQLMYWEGAVGITGSKTGRGYVELTGYGGSSGLGR